LWDVKPLDAISFSASKAVGCDAQFSSNDVGSLSVRDFLKVVISALPRCGDFGRIVGFARTFFRHVADRGEVGNLIDMTNYIFKSVALSQSEFEPLLAERALRLCRELHYWANINLHGLRSKSSGYRDLPEALDAALWRLSFTNAPGDVAFVFLTAKYLENFGSWLDLYQRYDRNGAKLLVLAIGDGFEAPIGEWLAARGADAARVVEFQPPKQLGVCGNGNYLNFLWYVKVHAVDALVQRGVRVVYSDLDAYWIKDYWALRDWVNAESSADAILSVTYDMPRCAVVEQSFTPCAGFFSAEPTRGGKAFMAAWRHLTEVMFDDQIGLAELLFRSGASWSPVRSHLVGADMTVTTAPGTPAKIVALDAKIARRVGLPDPATIGDSTIWHPRWVMAPDQHKEVIQRLAQGG